MGPQNEGLWRPFFSAFLLYLVASYYIKGDLTWGRPTRWTNIRYIQFRLLGELHNYTDSELAQFDGRDTTKPILLAIKGDVFDVSAKPETYGPLGAYNKFAGRDAARAFGTGCFSTDLTWDLRELDQETLDAIEGWHRFFHNNPKYWLVGHVQHEDLTGDPPAPCHGRQKP